MAAEQDAGERTEAPTQKRLSTAREQGQVPLSRDAAAAALPALLVILATGAAAALVQTGLLFRVAALKPDFGRLNPATGLKRIAGVESLSEAAKSVAKVAVAGVVVWRTVGGAMGDIGHAPDRGAAGLADAIARQVLAVLLALFATQAAIAGLDVLIVRLRHMRAMRMSREEVREEQRESDGDPKIKARIRQLRQSRARRRMMAAVAQAAVVVTNPTHYAVALAYQRGRQAAPRVVAKGVDEMAARIRAAAEQHRVPQVANPPIARALHRVELDAEIPAELYQAVAEIIAYVWRLNRPAAAGGPVR